MRKLLFLLLLTLPLFAYSLDKGDTALDFTGKDLEGNTITLSDYKGEKPVLLVFWATWCPECNREISLLKELYKKYGKKIEFISIDVAINEKLKKVKKFVAKNELPYRTIFDEKKEIIKKYKVSGIPTNIVIDKSGKIVYRVTGFAHGLEDLIISVID